MKTKVIKIVCYLNDNHKFYGFLFECEAVDTKGDTYSIVGTKPFAWRNSNYGLMLKEYCKYFNKMHRERLEYIPISLFRQEFKKQYPKYKLNT